PDEMRNRDGGDGGLRLDMPREQRRQQAADAEAGDGRNGSRRGRHEEKRQRKHPSQATVAFPVASIGCGPYRGCSVSSRRVASARAVDLDLLRGDAGRRCRDEQSTANDLKTLI